MAKDVTIVVLRHSVKGLRVLRREVLMPVWVEVKVQSRNVAVWAKEVTVFLVLL